METNEEEPETESPQSLVGILNDEWEEAHGYDSPPPFEFRTDGTVDAIYFRQDCLWHDAEDPREWDTEKDTRPRLGTWLRDEVRKLAVNILKAYPDNSPHLTDPNASQSES